jgi:hypothetical protein
MTRTGFQADRGKIKLIVLHKWADRTALAKAENVVLMLSQLPSVDVACTLF